MKNKIISGARICNSQLNRSKAKYMYSFSKAERFPKIYSYSDKSQFFYNLPSMKEKRSTTLGYGSRYDMTKDSNISKSVFYDFKRDFDPKNLRGPKFSFGVSRDHMHNIYEFSGPGPGKYNTRRPFGKDAAKYSIRMKLYRSESCENYKSPGPGPGAYKSITKINPNGTYFMSKNENVHPVEFSKDKTERFSNPNDITPGPCYYKLKNSTFGRIFESRFKSTNGISMRPRFKIIDYKQDYPGPGAYSYFSEFGVFENDNDKIKDNKK